MAITSSKRSSTTMLSLTIGFYSRRIFTWAKSSSLFLISKTPSHPIKSISMSPVSSLWWISGKALITCFYGGSSLFLLKSKSPMALDKFRDLFTRPSLTNPPAPTIRFFSSGSSGLWSSNGYSTSWFLLSMMQRESPQLAIKS